MKNFVLIGAGGYAAPRHLKAIKETGNNLLAALDKHDSVGVLDSYFPDAHFFTEFERFDRHLDKLKRQGIKTDFVSVCSPNYLHDAHIRMGLRIGADVICEKPIVLNPWNIDALAEIEKETGRKIYCILQLRLHPSIIALRNKIKAGDPDRVYDVKLNYITSRGRWYHSSWKGSEEKSGGIATNIGVHFFDMLMWIFGDCKTSNVEVYTADTAKGKLVLTNANVDWNLSINENMLPADLRQSGKKTFRTLKIDDEEFEFSEGFTDLHSLSYLNIMEGKGFGIADTKKAIELVHQIRNEKK